MRAKGRELWTRWQSSSVLISPLWIVLDGVWEGASWRRRVSQNTTPYSSEVSLLSGERNCTTKKGSAQLKIQILGVGIQRPKAVRVARRNLYSVMKSEQVLGKKLWNSLVTNYSSMVGNTSATAVLVHKSVKRRGAHFHVITEHTRTCT